MKAKKVDRYLSPQDPGENDEQSTHSKNRGLKGLMLSRSLWALILFVGTCQIMGMLKVGDLPPQDVAYPTWTSWAINDFLKPGKERPELVFLGSSLMLVPLDGVDADYTNEQVDGAMHHKSIFFESKFKEYAGSNVSTFNFALPGEMPSDAYLITRFLLKDEKRPDVIVYGVGPRDFMDNLLPSPRATDPFRYLSRFGDYHDRIGLIAPEWDGRLAYEMGRALYPLGNCDSIGTSMTRKAESIVASVFPQIEAGDHAKRRLLLPDYHPFEIQPNECWFRPTNDKNRPGFTDNIDEYRKRYKKLKWDTFLSQMNFLADILNISKERGIHVVVVAMPITDINRKLISDEAWNAYKTSLSALAKSKDASFVDLYETNAFPLSDFGDTVHLHSGGGKRLLDMLAQRMSKDHAVLSSLDMNRTEDTKQAIAGVKDSNL